jgi:hypothetical protein
MNTTVIRGTAQNIDAYFDKVASLFLTCYGRPLERALWEQFYLQAPYGHPLGILGYDTDKLVGFYGLIPQMLKGPDDVIDYLLSMTLMLHPDNRGVKSFLELVNVAMDAAREEAADFVLGFPNENSYLPLVRFCQWRSVCETGFYRINVHECRSRYSYKISEIESLSIGHKWSVPYENSSYMEWRSARYDYHLVEIGEKIQVVYKVLSPAILDVMDGVRLDSDINGYQALKHLAQVNNCTSISITGYHADQLGFSRDDLLTMSDYRLRMSVFALGRSLPDIHLSLLMSDIY